MLDKLINAKGGLHNRLTQTLCLKPFDLNQTGLYLKYLGVKLSQKQVLDFHMVAGGVPYYLNQVRQSCSLVQNINQLCFSEDGLLYSEFTKLFNSLFDMADENLRIVRQIAASKNGLMRKKLLEKLKIASGGNINERLSELEAAGFIQSYRPLGKSKRDRAFRVIDEYVLFYLHWIEQQSNSGYPFSAGYWQTKQKTPEFHAWSGNAFEAVCLKHIEKIRQALGLSRIACRYAGWFESGSSKCSTQGAQIDLLIDRDDGVISICEMKFFILL